MIKLIPPCLFCWRGIITLLLTLTVCGTLIAILFRYHDVEIGFVPTESRRMIFELLIFMTGVVSGFVGRSGGK